MEVWNKGKEKTLIFLNFHSIISGVMMTRAVTEVESFEIIWCKYAKLHVFANPASNSKGLGEKQKIRTGGGINDYGIPRAWRGKAFWNFRRHWGVKIWKLSVGTDIFWNRPLLQEATLLT